MKNLSSGRPVFFIIFVLTLIWTLSIAGCFVGGKYFEKTYTATFSPKSTPDWIFVGTPPEKAMRIVDADLDFVYVETTEQRILSCYWITPLDNECWIEVKEIAPSE